MKRMAHTLARAVLLAGAIALAPAGGALAQEPEKTPEALAAEALDKLVSALSLFLQSIPQYETPEILPNGDIIIRRVQPGDGGEEESPEADGPSDQGDDAI